MCAPQLWPSSLRGVGNIVFITSSLKIRLPRLFGLVLLMFIALGVGHT
jgi:hypothetical protein